jgi:hypothetical protein
MSITEIQTTIDELRKRHPELDEALLVTLLRAGGWDAAAIREATIIFAMMPRATAPHTVPSHKRNQDLPTLAVREPVPLRAEIELPDNLPLLPSESLTHAASFADYKDILHDEEVHLEKLVVPTSPPAAVLHTHEEQSKHRVEHDGHTAAHVGVRDTARAEDPHHSVRYHHAADLPAPSMTKDEQGLVIITGVLLALLILILTYMHSVGRF